MGVIIGVTGRVCAGKSLVTEAFRKCGAEVWRADPFVHQLYGQADVKAEVRALFGPDVFAADGTVDRKKLGALVFADARLLRTLTDRVIYPRTGVELRRLTAAFRAAGEGGAAALILDAPTLFESGHKDFCDRILFVTASLSRREAWALKERGWSAEELVRRDAHLIVESEKRALADAVVSNDGTRKKLDEQAAHLWRLWVQ